MIEINEKNGCSEIDGWMKDGLKSIAIFGSIILIQKYNQA